MSIDLTDSHEYHYKRAERQFRGRGAGATGRCAIDFFKGTRRYHLKTTMTIKKDSPGWAVFFRLEVRG